MLFKLLKNTKGIRKAIHETNQLNFFLYFYLINMYLEIKKYTSLE